jgi:hypothetical protein
LRGRRAFGVPSVVHPRIENRSDVHVSTLSDYIAALGGRLEILAVFPEGTVRIAQFGNGGDA